MTQQQPLKLPKGGQDWIARRRGYISCIEKYPLYSLLLVLQDYVSQGFFEECAIIKEALDEYNIKKVEANKNIIGNITFPTQISEYEAPEFQKMLINSNIVVDKKLAQQKATLIKLKFPLKKWHVK